MRAFYRIALITGGVILYVHGVAVLAIINKASAALFIILLALLFVIKWHTKKAFDRFLHYSKQIPKSAVTHYAMVREPEGK